MVVLGDRQEDHLVVLQLHAGVRMVDLMAVVLVGLLGAHVRVAKKWSKH